MLICVFIYLSICVYTYVHICTRVCVCIHADTHTNMQISPVCALYGFMPKKKEKGSHSTSRVPAVCMYM